MRTELRDVAAQGSRRTAMFEIKSSESFSQFLVLVHKRWAPDPDFYVPDQTAPTQPKTFVWAAAAGNARPKSKSNNMEFERPCGADVV